MATAFVIFDNHVLLFFYSTLQTTTQINTLSQLIPLIGIIFIIAVGVVLLNLHFQRNLFKQKLEKEEIRNIQQKELLQTSILAEEKEKKRIAQDIHDELGALLSISRMHIAHLEENKIEFDKLAPALENIRTLIDKALIAMRRISHELMPPQLENFGLIKTLLSVAHHANKTNQLNIQIESVEALPSMSWSMQLGLYRICMELINNTIKHSNADTILIQFIVKETEISCFYFDDGIGTSNENFKLGLGLKNMETRANSLGGYMTLNKVKEGFQAQIVLPIII